jgi:Mn2+/Fe2+ NRAMP family transporter
VAVGEAEQRTASPTPTGGPAEVRQAGYLRRYWAIALAALCGPGLIVMLADTDAGSVITAAQSGARWGYGMILPQLLLVPVLYVVQEMTVRLGILTKRGHGALIRECFGPWCALLSAGTLFLSSVGALITEFAAVAGVGEMFGVSRWVTIPIATAFLIGLSFVGSYRRAERVGIAIGLAELAFIPAMLASHPALSEVASGALTPPAGNSGYLYLLAANVGAVIMPWMIFYQQGAVIDRGFEPAQLRGQRRATAVGALVTQAIMIAVIVILAATVGRSAAGGSGGSSLNSVGEISGALVPYLGTTGAKVLFGAGILGAALVAALVSSLAGAWGLAEIFGWRHTLNERPSRRTAGFYVAYAFAHVAGAVLVLAAVDLVSLAIDAEVMNALLLPVVLGFLLALERRALPAESRMRGARKWATWGLCLVTMAFGLYMIPALLGLTALF